MERREYKTRRVTSRGTQSYQLGHYEMQGEKGKRSSRFKVIVHLGEHATPEDAVEAWSEEIGKLREMGRDSKASKLERELDELRSIS